MKIEYEATFTNVEKDDVRRCLREAGATLVHSERLMRRVVFRPPSGHEIEGGWLRVRDEGDRITLSLKVVIGARIEDQKEIELTVDDFEAAVLLLETLGCRKKAFQETRRERWEFMGTQVTLDEWPFLEPFVEIEGRSEDAVRRASQGLGFDMSQAYFGAVDGLYARKYGVSEDTINNRTPEIVFSGPNPFTQSAAEPRV